MTPNPTTIARAYPLVESRICRTVSDVKDGLRNEGWTGV